MEGYSIQKAHMKRLSYFVLLFSLVVSSTEGIAEVFAKPDANTIVVDLDKPTKEVYEFKTLTHLRIGSKPGECGIEPADTGYVAPSQIMIDSKKNLYIDDPVKLHFQKFNKNGKFIDMVPSFTVIDYADHVFGGNSRDQILELVNGKVEKTYKMIDEGLLRLMPDGKVVFFNSKTNYYDSLDGTPLSPATIDSKEMFPWTKGRRIIIAFGSPDKIEISFFGDPTNTKIVLKPKNNIQFGSSTDQDLYFAVHAKDQDFVLHIHFSDSTVEAQSIPLSDKYPRILGPLTRDGEIYGIYAGERGGPGSGEYFCDIMKAVIIPKK